MDQRYAKSEAMLDRALRSVPLGAQTFSKSLTQFPRGATPYFVTGGKGSRLWDVDGNEYVDFVNGLAAVLLGYCDPDVDAAVREQLAHGVTFSLSHPLELEVAETICEWVPCAEKIRFAKNGSDATSAAIRLARAHTGRDRVATCGYHGWQDWYIGSTTRDLGVPAATRELTHPFVYNDVTSLERLFEQHPDEVAAVILEPMNAVFPADGFLEAVADLTRANGALLVFDETITGFRYARGGAQELFGVTPDLATFGKGLANGLPLSVVAGKTELMRGMEQIFFSTTFGGETLSLAAARAVLDKLQREPVIETLASRGKTIMDGVRRLIEKHGMHDLIDISGHPSWTFLHFKDAGPYSLWDLKTFFIQETLARGILTLGTHNLSYAHTEEDIDRLLQAYDNLFPEMRRAVDGGRLIEALRCEPLRPLFRVR